MAYKTEPTRNKPRDGKFDFFTCFLLFVAFAGPPFFLLSFGGVMVSDGPMSTLLEQVIVAASIVVLFSAGVVGCLASILAYVRSRKRKGRLFVRLLAAFLFVLNLLIIPPVFSFAASLLSAFFSR